MSNSDIEIPSFELSLETYLMFSLNLLSLISILIFFIRFLITKNIHTFAKRLVLYLQMTDFISSFCCVLVVFDIPKYEILCEIQAFFLNFGYMSSMCWSVIISWIIYSEIYQRTPMNTFKKQEKTLCLSVFSFTMILSLM